MCVCVCVCIHTHFRLNIAKQHDRLLLQKFHLDSNPRLCDRTP